MAGAASADFSTEGLFEGCAIFAFVESVVWGVFRVFVCENFCWVLLERTLRRILIMCLKTKRFIFIFLNAFRMIFFNFVVFFMLYLFVVKINGFENFPFGDFSFPFHRRRINHATLKA